MLRLSEAFNGFDVTFVSVGPNYGADVPNHRYYGIRDVSRRDRLGYFVLLGQLIRILLIERPQVVITTGSAPGAITLALAKTFLHAKTIWIDSIANCEQMSTSGKHAHHFADVWLTQWPALARPEGPQYLGAVL